jgi:hypothetical protein
LFLTSQLLIYLCIFISMYYTGHSEAIHGRRSTESGHASAIFVMAVWTVLDPIDKGRCQFTEILDWLSHLPRLVIDCTLNKNLVVFSNNRCLNSGAFQAFEVLSTSVAIFNVPSIDCRT